MSCQLLPHECFYIAAREKESADARILCSFDIAFSIPEKDRPVFIYAVCIKRTKDHPRRRLAAAAYLIIGGKGRTGKVRTVEKLCDMPAPFLKFFIHFPMELPDRFFGEIAACHTTLVCHDKEKKAGLGELGYDLPCAFHPAQLPHLMHIAIIFIEDTVAVKKDRFSSGVHHFVQSISSMIWQMICAASMWIS